MSSEDQSNAAPKNVKKLKIVYYVSTGLLTVMILGAAGM